MIHVPPELPKPPVVPPPPNKPPPVLAGAAPKPVPVEPKPVGRREHLGKRLIALGVQMQMFQCRGALGHMSAGRERKVYIPVVGVEVEPKPPKPPVDCCCCCCCCCWPKPPKPPKPDIVADVSYSGQLGSWLELLLRSQNENDTRENAPMGRRLSQSNARGFAGEGYVLKRILRDQEAAIALTINSACS